MFYLFASLYGIAHGSCFALIAPMTAELFGLESLGSIMGIVFFVGTSGSIISPWMAGRIFDITESYDLAFWICFGFSIIGIILIFLLRPIASKGGSVDPGGSTRIY